MITLRFLPFPSYSGDGAQRHLVLLQCPSPKGGVCIFYQKVINVPWYNGVKKRRGKTTSWFHYALLISQSHYHKNASMSLENRSIVSMIQLKNLIQPKRWLGDFPPCMVNVHRVTCINTNVSGKHCNESIRSVAIKWRIFYCCGNTWHVTWILQLKDDRQFYGFLSSYYIVRTLTEWNLNTPFLPFPSAIKKGSNRSKMNW